MLVKAIVTTGLLLAAAVHAQQPASPPAAESVEVLECLVYSEADKTKRHDCTGVARESCKGAQGTCELPIGLALSGGEDLDGDGKTWEKVRVSYRCGQRTLVNGPHHQNDHATALLACRGF